MLHVEQALAQPNSFNKPPSQELLPKAAVDVDFTDKRRALHLTLAGVIQGESSILLHRFLTDVSSFRGNEWTLDMQNLKVLSSRGIASLVEFSRKIRCRGFHLVVSAVHQNIYSTLCDLDLVKEFGWCD